MQIFVHYQYHMYCLDSSDGKMLWDYPVSKSVMMEAGATKDKVFFGGMDGCIRALDITTGVGADNVTVTDTAPTTTTSLNTNTGADTVAIDDTGFGVV